MASARKIKDSILGLEIFVVAVGSYVNGIKEMANVASSPPEKYVFRVEKVSDLEYVFDFALHKISPNKYKVKKPTHLCD